MADAEVPEHVLLGACRRGDLVLVQRTLSSHSCAHSCAHSCDAHVCDESGNTALHWAARRGHMAIVREIASLYTVTPTTEKNRDNQTPLHLACEQGHLEVARFLARKFPSDIEERDCRGDTPLHVACLHRQIDLVRMLCQEFGCNSNLKGNSGRGCLHHACSVGQLELVRCLVVECNCDRMLTDDRGNVALHCASYYGHLELLSLLVRDFEFSVSVRNSSGVTVLHCACAGGHGNLARRLIEEFGQDPHHRDSNGCDSLFHTVNNSNVAVDRSVDPMVYAGWFHEPSDFDHIQTVRMLVTEYHCLPNVPDNYGGLPIHAACQSGHLELVRVLLSELKCDCSAVDKYGNTPIYFAAKFGRTEIVEMLATKFNSPVDCVNSDKVTPLHIAAFWGHVETARLLIHELGAEKNLVDKFGHTPLEVAQRCNRPAVAEILSDGQPVYPVVQSSPAAGSSISASPVSQSLSITDNSAHSLPLSHGRRNSTPAATTPAPAVSTAAPHSLPAVGNATTAPHSLLPPSADNSMSLDAPQDSVNVLSSPQQSLHRLCREGNLTQVEAVLQSPECDIMAPDESGSTPLHVAVAVGHRPIVRLLVTRYSVHCGGTNNDRETPLHIACFKNHLEIVRTLAEHFSEDLKARDSHGDTPLHIASLYGHHDMVQLLCQQFGCDPNVPGSLQRTCLHHACSNGNVQLASQLILDFRCDPLAKDMEGSSPLHCASYYGHTLLVERLADSLGVSLDTKGPSGSTLLHHAAGGGHLELVRKLITKYNFNPFQPDARGCDALHNAIEHAYPAENNANNPFDPLAKRGFFHNSDIDHVATVQALISEFGCIPLSKSNTDATAFGLALTSNHPGVANLLMRGADVKQGSRDLQERTTLHFAAAVGDIGMIEKLVSVHSHDLMARDHQGATPLHTAALHGQKEATRKLIKLGCPPEVRSDSGHTPLHCACQCGHVSTIRTLIEEFHCDPNCVEDSGGMPIHQAAVSGQTETVRVLVREFSCPVNAVNATLLTPLHLACHEGHEELVRVLVNELGADQNMVDIGGHTASALALLAGRSRISSILTSMGPSQSLQRRQLHEAAEKNDWDAIVRVVREENCSQDARDSQGYTALHVACREGHSGLVCKLIATLNCSLLIRSEQGELPLHLAIQHGREEVVDLLLSQFSCNPLEPGPRGKTPVHLACQAGNTGMVRRLVTQHGVDPMVVDSDGNTPLHLAALHDRPEVVRLLLVDFLCYPDIENTARKTPLGLATERGHQHCIELLSRSNMVDTAAPLSKEGGGQAADGSSRTAENPVAPYMAVEEEPTFLPKVLVMGGVKAGKSSLVQALRDCHTLTCDQEEAPLGLPHGYPQVMTFHGTQEMTCEVALVELTSDPEVHAPLVEKLLHPPTCVLLVVVDLESQRSSVAQELGHWLRLVSYSTAASELHPKVILVGSHADILLDQFPDPEQCLSEAVAMLREEMEAHCDSLDILEHFALNPESPARGVMRAVGSRMQEALLSLAGESTAMVSKGACILLDSLWRDLNQSGSHSGSVVAVSSLVSRRQSQGEFHSFSEDKVVRYARELEGQGLVLLSPDEEWVISPCSLLSTLCQMLSPLTATEPAGTVLASGLLTSEKLTAVLAEEEEVPFPIAAWFLEEMNVCCKVGSPTSILPWLDLPLQTEGSAAGEDVLYFFPSLVSTSCDLRPSQWLSEEPEPIIKSVCIRTHGDTFPSRYSSVLQLRLVSLIINGGERDDPSNADSAQRKCCRIWRHGVYWRPSTGGECLVQMEESGRSVLAVVRGGQTGYCDGALASVFAEVMGTRDRICRCLQCTVYLVLPKSLSVGHVPRDCSELCLVDLNEVKVAVRLKKTRGREEEEEEEEAIPTYSDLQCLRYWDVLFPLQYQHVVTYLQPLAQRWREIGSHLEMRDDMLQAINIAPRGPRQTANQMSGWPEDKKDSERDAGFGDMDAKCQRMVMEWMASPQCLPGWAVLVRVLDRMNLSWAVSRITADNELAVALQTQLLSNRVTNCRVDNVLLDMLVVAAGNQWHFLAAVLGHSVADLERVIEKRRRRRRRRKAALHLLCAWRDRTQPTYGDLLQVFLSSLFPSPHDYIPTPSVPQSLFACGRDTPHLRTERRALVPASSEKVKSLTAKTYSSGSNLNAKLVHYSDD